MKPLELRTIADLDQSDPHYVMELIRKWDPAREIEEWSVGARGYKTRVPLDWNLDRDVGFHPSSLHHTCNRYQYYELIGKVPVDKPPASMVKRFDTGTAIHGLLHYYLITLSQELGFVYKMEHSVKKRKLAQELELVGRVDGLVSRVLDPAYLTTLDRPVRFRCVMEYKSCSVKSFAERERRPERKHIVQVHPYMATMDVPLALILYYRKDDGHMIIHPVLFDKEIWSEIEARLRSILSYRDRMDAPPRRDAKGCKSCGFLWICKPAEAEPTYKRFKWDDQED